MRSTLEDRLAAIEILLGLRDLDDPKSERLRFEQAAYAGKLLSFAANSFDFETFRDDFLASYVRARLERLQVTKQNLEPCDCNQCVGRSE